MKQHFFRFMNLFFTRSKIGFTNSEISKELDRSIDSIAAKKARLDICKTYTKFTYYSHNSGQSLFFEIIFLDIL